MVYKDTYKDKHSQPYDRTQDISKETQIAKCSNCRKELNFLSRKEIKSSEQCNCKCEREQEEFYVFSCGDKMCKTRYTNQRVCGSRIYCCRCHKKQQKMFKNEMLNPESTTETSHISDERREFIDVDEQIEIYYLRTGRLINKPNRFSYQITGDHKVTAIMFKSENRIASFTQERRNSLKQQDSTNNNTTTTKSNKCPVEKTMPNEHFVGHVITENRNQPPRKQRRHPHKQQSRLKTTSSGFDIERTMPNVNVQGMTNIDKIPTIPRYQMDKEEKWSADNEVPQRDKVRPRNRTVSLRSEKTSTGLVARVTNKELLNELITAFFQEFYDARSTSNGESPDFIHKMQDGSYTLQHPVQDVHDKRSTSYRESPDFIPEIQDGSYILQHPEKNVAPLEELDMGLYFNRLFSFSNWPENSPVSAIKLASAGFYYTGEGQNVRCFSCRLLISNWSAEDNPLLVHQERSLNCDFIKTKQESGELSFNGREATSLSNLPYVQEPSIDNATGTGYGVVEEIARPQSALQARRDEDEIGLNTNSIDEDSSLEGISQGLSTLTVASKSGKPVLQPSDSPPSTIDNSISEINSASLSDQQPQRQFQQNLGLHEQQGQGSHQQNSSEHEQQIQRNVQPNNALLPVEHVAISMPQNGGDVFDYDIMANARHPQYTNTQYRLQSYRNWTHHNMQHPQTLAEAGFYYTGTLDTVRCFNCDIGLADWDVQDNPWVEHARHSPYCSFLKHVKGEEFIRSIQDAWREIYTPKHPVYDDINARLQTFRRWPSDLSQTPQQLANAGFYYTGEDDTVRCHYCDGGLRQWEWNDDPWVEHARWFPYCKFVLKMRGVAFIEEVARTYNDIYVNQTQEPPTGAAFEPFYGGDEFSPPEEYTTPENGYPTGQRRNALTTPAAENVLEMGYNRNVLIMAINKFVKRTDTRDFTADHLLNIILDTDDGELPPPDEDSDATHIGLQDIPRIQPEELDTDELRKVNKQIKENVFLCKQCKIRDRNMIFLPCGHRDMCEACAEEVMICTTCGDFIDKRVKTFLS